MKTNMTHFKALAAVMIIGLVLSALLPSCSQPVTCEGNSTCVHGYLIIISNCTCFCENEWEGKQCDVCNLADDDCNNGFANGEECRCECDPGWCGADCDIPILDCENGGTWNEFLCACDCPEEWAGAVCDSMI
jgi:hypothetical protein